MIINSQSESRKDKSAREWELARRMVSSLAHELNNHLAPVLLSLSVLGRKVSTEDQEILDLAHRGVKRGSRLVQQLEWILDRERTEPVDCDLRQILKTVERALAKERKDLRVLMEMPEAPLVMQGDPLALLRAFTSLTQLGCEAMPEGEAWLKILVEPVEDSKGAWHFVRLIHPGESVGPQDLDDMEAPVSGQMPSSMRTRVDLVALVSVVREHGGRIEVEPRAERTCFRIHLPALEALGSAAPGVQHTRRRNGLVMVVDDQPAVRRVLQSLLGMHGFRSRGCSDGLEALEVFRERQGRVAAVLTDVSMPAMSGVELGERLRRIAPEVPLVFMTGAREDKASALNINGEPVPVLSKPFTGETLLEALDSALAAP